jgi:periplasmic copper chaperone A
MMRRAAGLLLAALAVSPAGLLSPGPAAGHDFRAGAIVIDHPYAPPTPGGATTGAVYFRTLKNTGREPDRLLSASSPAAAVVELHRSTIENDVMKMRQLPALDLPPGASLKVRHGGEIHLMLIGLKAPLKNGDRFPVRLKFERAGEREIVVHVQQPRTDGKPPPGHNH